MPVYEYEPDDRECLLCEGKIAIIQRHDEPPEKYCPWCGLDVVKVFSPASIIISKGNLAERGAKGGFTTWRKSTDGTWDKVAGGGVDHLVGTDEAKQQIADSKVKPKVFEI